MGFPRLLADVGGTNVRFACQLQPGGALLHRASYACVDFETLWDAMSHYLWSEGRDHPLSAAIGIATPIIGDHVRMTNHHWAFSIKAMQHELGLSRLVVLNDFTALALALPALGEADLRQVGGGRAVAGAPIGLIGPGTGLGVSGLLPVSDGNGFAPISGEGGHVTLFASSPDEAAVMQVLQRRFGHVSAERALSGPGLENLYQALAEVHGVDATAHDAASITRGAMSGADALCTDTVNLFCGLLGDVAGNLALTLGARGGLYIGGGIVSRLGDGFERSAFRRRFESKGRFCSYLQAIPTFVLKSSDEAALLGVSRALSDESMTR